MRFEVSLERVFPQSIQTVWRGLTEATALSAWLMQTDDFVAGQGRRFTMYCPGDEGEMDEYHCQVLALEAPRYMRWSWSPAGNEGSGITEVEFRLSEIQEGTRLVVCHMGDRDRTVLERFKAGWPHKLSALAEYLEAQDR